jgi:preprotein translocase subunit SecG
LIFLVLLHQGKRTNAKGIFGQAKEAAGGKILDDFY